MSSTRTCMSSSDLNVMRNMNAVVQEEYPGFSSTSTINCLPVGYRFLPTDTELIVHYLKRKVNNQQLPCNNIHTVNLYELRPEDLCGKEWYLFCPRKRRSSSGTRADRTTPYGYWKTTSGDRAIRHNEEVDHQQQQTFSTAFESLAPANTFTTPFSMPEIDEVLFLGSTHSTKQGCSDQYKSSYGHLFHGFDQLMDKGMEFLPDVMSMDF
ncbi:UNVERIFIED_CONTAM: NAC domain-containing protein 86 [Sesamum latifolium]|uniref:NAC domain-containing protein 86 n=1 Tax=Sesamum latifolium TaxID=2727402 RepID=A0AAW2XJ74_9LAMI